MTSTALVFALTTAICISSLAAACAVVFWRRASELTSLATRFREVISYAETSESRIDELHKRITSLSKKFHLEERRDPDTGRAQRKEEDEDDPYARKAALRRKYGLAGLSHAEIARRATRGVSEN